MKPGFDPANFYPYGLIMVYNLLTMLNCTHCGQENRMEAVFCRNCGQPLTANETANTSPSGEEPPGMSSEPLSETPPELTEGAILGERYRIRQKLIDSEGNIQYEADDLLSCWNCRAIQSALEQPFCEVCGAELTTTLQVLIIANQPSQESNPEQSTDNINDAGIRYRIQQPELATKSEPGVARMRLISGFQSHPGKVRGNNEDSLITLLLAGLCNSQCPPPVGFFAVADGVGGAESGEVASQLAVRYLAGSVIQRVFNPAMTGTSLSVEELPALMTELVLSANRAILELRSHMVDNDMGSTLTSALLHGAQAIVANVGDSRTYLLHQGTLSLVTQDHSVVAQLVEQGVIQPEEVYTHQQRNIIYRSLGSRNDLEVDVFTLALEPGDRLLLCSDGLWEMVHDEMIEEVLLERNDPQQASNRLVELANLAGGDDNVTVIVLNIQE